VRDAAHLIARGLASEGHHVTMMKKNRVSIPSGRAREQVQGLWTVAVVGAIAAASMFAVVLLVSRDLVVASVAAVPGVAAVIAFGWAAVAHGPLGSDPGRAERRAGADGARASAPPTAT
jgi:hypothetical protein